MKILRVSTKVLTLIFLLFVNTVSAQTSDSIYTLRAGTVIRARMDNEINSRVSSVNDTFTVTVSRPVIVRETEILSVGTILEGRVIRVKPATFGGTPGSLEVEFETLRLVSGAQRQIEAVIANYKILKADEARSIFTIIGTAAAGALIGAAAKKENGLLIGAGIGAGAGTGAVLLQKGREARIKTDEEIEIRLKKDVTLPVEDY